MIDQLPILIVVFPFIFSLLIGMVGSFKKNVCFPLAIFSIICSLICSIAGIYHTFNHSSISYNLGGWVRSIGIEFYLNSYNSILIFLVNFVVLAVLIYSRKFVYLKFYERLYAFYALLLFFVTGNLGIIITGDAFNLYVFLEIVSLSSYAMIALGRKEAYVAALRYLIIGTVGASFYLLGVGILYLQTGNLNMLEIHKSILKLQDLSIIRVAFVFIVVGLSVKIAFFPFHSWLPFAYSKTISSVSILMTPIVTKVSLFACIKIIIAVFGFDYLLKMGSFKLLLPNIAALGMLHFSIKAFSQKNIRTSFCYVLLMECSLMFGAIWFENIIGLKTVLYHIALDIVMTLSLFLFAGILQKHYRIYKYDDVSNINVFAQNKVLCLSFIVVLCSILGIPPTGGFFSKFYFILSAFKEGSYFYIISLLISSFILLALFLKFFESLYFNNKKFISNKKEKVSFLLNLIFVLSTIFIFLIGFKTSIFMEKIIPSFLG